MNTTDCEKMEDILASKQLEVQRASNMLGSVEQIAHKAKECCSENELDAEANAIDIQGQQIAAQQELETCLAEPMFEVDFDKNDNQSVAICERTPTHEAGVRQNLHKQLNKQSLLELPALDSEEFEDAAVQPLTERWSPLGANYDDALSPNSELLSPVSELDLLSTHSQEEKLDAMEMSRLRSMEDEQELLTNSLLALTSHFAHVQLRVRQIVEAPPAERDQLLKDLEEFAFQGIPEPLSYDETCFSGKNAEAADTTEDDAVRQRQFELIKQLKTQLSELENVAYESGAPVLPQHMLLEKQKIIIDELKSKLNLKVDEHDLPQLSSEQLKNQVDCAIGEFVGPLKMKDQLVAQLKTQITDLERFIAFLQCDGSDDYKMKALTGNEKISEAYNSYAAKKKTTARIKSPAGRTEVSEQRPTSTDAAVRTSDHSDERESLNSKAHGLLDKASMIMQMFASTHFGAAADQFQKNSLKRTNKGNHWGDLRAQLEVDIQEVASLAATLSIDREKLAKMKRSFRKSSMQTASTNDNRALVTIPPQAGSRNCTRSSHIRRELQPYALSSDSEDDTYDSYVWERSSRRKPHSSFPQHADSMSAISKELATAVRKNFAMTLQRLMQHGLHMPSDAATTSLMLPFMRCFHPASHRSYADRQNYWFGAKAYDEDGGVLNATAGARQMHAWEFILEYYYLKHGDDYNNTPARKLSQSFNLDIMDSQENTSKQSLLSAIGMIIAMHRPYKRSFNAHFKAFVCAALNCQQLVEWLNLILSCNELVANYYSSSSYVARTGFRDSLRSIDVLSKYEFDLPVDLAIRHFRNI